MRRNLTKSRFEYSSIFAYKLIDARLANGLDGIVLFTLTYEIHKNAMVDGFDVTEPFFHFLYVALISGSMYGIHTL